jgi:hypothetical protein
VAQMAVVATEKPQPRRWPISGRPIYLSRP